MKTRKFILLLMIAISLAGFSQEKWETLFNGKNLKGFKKLNGTAEFVVRDGAIVGTSKFNTPSTFLCTEKMYGDFILEMEFKVDSNLNSGIQFRTNSFKDYQNGEVFGYQYEIDPSTSRAWSGGIYDQSRRGWLYTLDLNPKAKKAFIANGWNKARIEAIGNNIRTWINGVPAANMLDNLTATGFIALQIHSIKKPEQDAKTVQWRNLRICTTNLDAVKTPYKKEIVQANCIDNTISAEEKENGWKLLWDGKTTEGWRGAKITTFPTAGWVIKDGMLSVVNANGEESTNGGDIVTTRKYKNFELLVDFKMTKGANSGIKYFVDTEVNKGEGSSIGCEFQILDDDVHPDAKLGTNGNRKIGSLYDLIPAPENKFYRMTDFNTARIVVNGNKVEHYLNNKKTVEYERGTQMWRALVGYSKYGKWPNFGEAAEGNILLQDHGNEVFFKNIKIKELK